MPGQDRRSGQPEAGRFLRREGNLKVRRERRQRLLARTLTRVTITAGAVGLAALAAGAGLRWLITAPALAITHVEIIGAQRADATALQELASGALNQNVLTVDLAQLAANVRTHPWVRDVVVRKRLPDTLEIRVMERVPCALALRDGKAFLMDSRGKPIDRYGPAYAGWSFPVLTGLDRLSADDRATRCRIATRQVRILQRSAPDVYAALTEVDLSDSRFTVLHLPSVEVALRVSPEDWLHNLEAWREMQETLQRRHGAVRYVDLRWRDRLVVLPVAQARD